MNTYGIALLCFVAVVLVLFAYDRVSGKNMLHYITTGRPILAGLAMLARGVGAATGSAYFNTAAIVIEAATDATQRAEDLWKAGSLPKEERNDYATLLIEKTLKDAGIEVTEQIDQIIVGAISLTCFILPHETVKEAAEV